MTSNEDIESCDVSDPLLKDHTTDKIATSRTSKAWRYKRENNYCFGRKVNLLLSLLVLGSIFICLAYDLKSRAVLVKTSSKFATWKASLEYDRALQAFSIKLTDAIRLSKPDIGDLKHYKANLTDGQYQPNRHQYSIHLNETQMNLLQHSHRSYTAMLREIDLSSIYFPESSGIVTTAGGRYLHTAVISIKLLRRTGSALPVEIFVAGEEEWDHTICDQILPQLNAQCRNLNQLLGDQSAHLNLQKFQYKVFAILLSSFENVLFLDADNLPLYNPDYMLRSCPEFTDKGMILWPDYWNATVSPSFYEVQGQEKLLSYPQSTTESGQMLINKTVHARTLLLATYYNVYGPDLYYSMLSQGAHGEGDKETYAAAAQYYGGHYHTVPHMLQTLGFRQKVHEGPFVHVAMIQYAPTRNKKPAFLHAHSPKMDPFTILSYRYLRDDGDKFHRLWTHVRDKFSKEIREWSTVLEESKASDSETWSVDAEHALFQEMISLACEYPQLDERKPESSHACAGLSKYAKEVYTSKI